MRSARRAYGKAGKAAHNGHSLHSFRRLLWACCAPRTPHSPRPMSQAVVGSVNSVDAKGDTTAVVGEQVSEGKSGGASTSWLSKGLKGPCEPAPRAAARCSMLHGTHHETRPAMLVANLMCAGEIHKKSPAGPIYQARTFVVADGIISYSSGKGESKTIPLADVKVVEASNPDRLEWKFTTVQVCERACMCHRSAKSHGPDCRHQMLAWQGKTYQFRVTSSEQYGYWVRGLQQIVAECQASSGSGGAKTLHSMAPTSGGGSTTSPIWVPSRQIPLFSAHFRRPCSPFLLHTCSLKKTKIN